MTEEEQISSRPRQFRLSLRELLGLITIAALLVGCLTAMLRLRKAEAELQRLRAETGYLSETSPGQIAAARAPSNEPLTYRFRVRVPESSEKFRIAYSSLLPKNASRPTWYAAVPLQGGESVVTIRIAEDPRDDRWKISVIANTPQRTNRAATVLPPDHVATFRGSYDVISTGIPKSETSIADPTTPIRLLDERWLVGEGSLLLYGDRAPDRDQVGIYAELQPDTGPL